ncbi:hypothetical protein BgiBS90_018921, partial [Biomphalaria glabrata]
MKEFLFLWTVTIVFLLVEAHPRLCDLKDYERTVVAPLGTSMNLSLCVIATVLDLQFPVVKLNNQSIPKYQETLNTSFSWQENNVSSPDVYTLTLYIKNVTVFDYGEWTLRLITAPDLWLNLNISINPSENRIFYFYMEDSDVAACEVNWFPKQIELKNKLTGQVLVKNNNRLKERRTVYGFLSTIGCENSGLYSCVSTDFRNRTYEKELLIRNPGCPVQFCDTLKTTELIATINKAVNMTLCLFYNDNIDVVLAHVENISIDMDWEVDPRSDKYLQLQLLFYDVQETFAGNHAIEIITVTKRTHKIQSLTRILEVYILKDVLFCDKNSNHSELYVSKSDIFVTEICLMGFYKDIKTARIKRIDNTKRSLYLKENIQSLYVKFKVILKGHLELCKHESNESVFSSHPFGDQVIHVCFLTDYTMDHMDHCFINNKRYPINEFAYDRDISVSVDQIKRNHQYFLQIYLHNVSIVDQIYALKLAPIYYHSLVYSFYTQIKQEKDLELVNCDGRSMKVVYYTSLLENLTVCAQIVLSGEKYSCIKSADYELIGNEGHDNHEFNNIFIKFGSGQITVDIINVTEYNFGRYDVRLHMCGNYFEKYTFYLVYNEELPSSVCKNGTVNFSLQTQPEEEVSLCFKSFGGIDRSILINNRSVPITSPMSRQCNVESNGFTVFSRWIKKWRTHYIQIYMPTANLNYVHIEQTLSNRVLVYKLIPVINEYTEYNITRE